MTINITTLTPLHISSGNEWQSNFEYLHFPAENCLAVVDPEKVLDVLGEENMGHWIACIEKGEPLLPVLQKRRAGLKAADVAARLVQATVNAGKPVKEQIRSAASGQPMLPGSSIKGALRTALFAKLVLDNRQLAKDRRNLGTSGYGGSFRFSDQPLQKSFFGQDPNHDIFRLLQTGDAVFENTQTEAVKIHAINKKFNRFEIKQDLTQYVEAIPADAKATARIQYNALLDRRTKNTFNANASRLKIEELFPAVNTHTLRILEDEINYWDETAGNPEALGDWVEEAQRIADIASACAAHECVVRIGWGSGFRFMTGDWHGAMADGDYDQMLKSVRPRHPVELIFPKSMRFIAGGKPLGFVKLSLAK